MSGVNFKEVKKIEFDVTKKLFKYIYTNINLNQVIEDLDREYSYFYDTDNNIAFNIWLSLDYIHTDGKTFTEKFLEDNLESLSINEKRILKERKDSYISLFKILKYEDKYTYVKDLLTEENFILLEPDLKDIIGEGEYIFSRIGKSLDNYNFIGDINYLPPSTNYDFKKKVIVDFNLARKALNGLTMKDYLKRFGLNLYKIYDELILNVIDEDDDLSPYTIDGIEESEEFEDYLSIRVDDDDILTHLRNISHSLPSYSSKNDSFKDLLEIKMDDIFFKSIDDALITSRQELLFYIDSLELYFKFLTDKNKIFEVLYKQILEIGKNPFDYLQYVHSYEVEFTIDKNFTHHIDGLLNENVLNLIDDFYSFLSHIEYKSIALTPKKKFIKRKDLFEIEENLKHKIKLSTKSPDQRDFINIDFYYHMALSLKLLSIVENHLVFNDLGVDYYYLEENEQYFIIFQYFLEELLNNGKIQERDFLLKTLFSMEISKEYPLEIFVLEEHNLLDKYREHLKLLGLVDYNIANDKAVHITSFGKKVLSYLDQNKSLYKDNLIYLSDYQN